jgi:hypothetical protein
MAQKLLWLLLSNGQLTALKRILSKSLTAELLLSSNGQLTALKRILSKSLTAATAEQI